MRHIVLTFDVDWAPDFAIDFVANMLLAKRVRATWFITHLSPATLRLMQFPDLFELGIHPNFLPGSSHGNSVDTVLQHCMSMLPHAESMRSHGLMQSTHIINQVIQKTSIKYDVSLLLPNMRNAHPIEYVWSGRKILRLPYMWEDYYEMGQVHPSWVIDPCTIAADGIKIINFHPIHLYLNMMSLEKYLALKQEVPDVSSATERDLSRYVTDGDGPRNLLLKFIEHLSHGNESWRIKDICETWTRSRTHPKEATCTAKG